MAANDFLKHQVLQDPNQCHYFGTNKQKTEGKSAVDLEGMEVN